MRPERYAPRPGELSSDSAVGDRSRSNKRSADLLALIAVPLMDQGGPIPKSDDCDQISTSECRR